MEHVFRQVIQEILATPNRPARAATPPPIRLSQNEMPWEPAPVVLDAMTAALHRAHRYPDYHRAHAREAVAAACGVQPDQVAVDNGSGTLLHALARLVCEPGRHGVYCWPSFDAYPLALRLTGAEATPVALAGSGAMDMAAMRAAIRPETRLVYLCNPNNPTGGVLGVAELRAFLAAVPSQVMVVLDEAYREFIDIESVDATVDLLSDYDNLVIVRTMSKAHGLAGVRAGYVLSSVRIAEALRRTTVGFALNVVAEAAIIAALSDEGRAIAHERISQIVAERTRLQGELSDRGVSHLASQANFVFLGGDAAELSSRLERHGVLARPFPQAGGVRVTVGLPDDNAAVLAALSAR
ncbi:histidinol-phosphate transaminase [Microbacterium sp.]|uniref:histidinol-phosphate transaminase n=1 Tax=Microbacterium sp. TaxID=51671 RepID=UPI003A87B24C